MKVTGNLLKTYFQNSSLEHKKVYLASVTDESIAENIAAFFQEEDESVVFECIDTYMQSTDGIGVTFSDFVMRLSEIKSYVKELEEDKKYVQSLMEKTKNRMKGVK